MKGPKLSTLITAPTFIPPDCSNGTQRSEEKKKQKRDIIMTVV